MQYDEPAGCACGRAWTPSVWPTLPLVGQWPEEALELRRCGCGSCISRRTLVCDEGSALGRMTDVEEAA